MSTSKYIDILGITGIIVALALVIAALFAFQPDSTATAQEGADKEYADTLFDDSVVHTLDIKVDDWDSFLESCENEEYVPCDVVIDGEEVQVVGLRAKGNTSLSTVKTLGSDRYSFKLEFDQYTESGNYHGLDKLSLNNLIQDSTYMKDYLTYKLMGEFGVNAPLCSYVYITVNGEDWGLYLAVEGVEDSFLERNYGSDYGDLYKPDSLGFGGGRGNGKGFDFDDFQNEDGTFDFSKESDSESSGDSANQELPEGFDPSNMPEGFDAPSMPEGFSGAEPPEGFDPSNLPEGFNGPDMTGSSNESSSAEEGSAEPSGATEGSDESSGRPPMPGGDDSSASNRPAMPGGGGGPGMGSNDVKLQYLDDDPDSYSNIFENAKTSVSAADKNRLIASLKNISEGEDIEESVDVEQDIRYFVVHNYVCNGDSYTGSMTHNYYLYEEDGLLSMIPWDYNLAFGTFMSGDATATVNDAIDSPLQASGDGSLPMFDFIVNNEEYLSLYHEYFEEFLDTVDVEDTIEQTEQLIAPYVQKDPTAFYSYENHVEGVETLESFCRLRTQSVKSQLGGSIPAADGDRTDETPLVDASDLDLSVMGSMGSAGGAGGPGGGPSGDPAPSGDFSPGTGSPPSGNFSPGAGSPPGESSSSEGDSASQ